MFKVPKFTGINLTILAIEPFELKITLGKF